MDILLTSWSRVFLEKLKVAQVFKKFPTFIEPEGFITVFTKSRQWFLS
jgi:hypothetical protein